VLDSVCITEVASLSSVDRRLVMAEFSDGSGAYSIQKPGGLSRDCEPPTFEQRLQQIRSSPRYEHRRNG
jgi:hypothetical protein